MADTRSPLPATLVSATHSWAEVVRAAFSWQQSSLFSFLAFACFTGSSRKSGGGWISYELARLPTFPDKLEYTSTAMMDKESMTDKTRITENDRRLDQRVPIRVPVKVRHQGSEHEAITRDLSSSGIFLYSESGMKAGSKLDLVIMLPAGLGLGPGGWTLCQASVVRMEESDGKGMGIAATLDRIEFLPEIS